MMRSHYPYHGFWDKDFRARRAAYLSHLFSLGPGHRQASARLDRLLGRMTGGGLTPNPYMRAREMAARGGPPAHRAKIRAMSRAGRKPHPGSRLRWMQSAGYPLHYQAGVLARRSSNVYGGGRSK